MKPRTDTIVVVAFLACAVFGFYASCEAPCAWFRGMAVKDVPARCLGVGVPK